MKNERDAARAAARAEREHAAARAKVALAEAELRLHRGAAGEKAALDEGGRNGSRVARKGRQVGR